MSCGRSQGHHDSRASEAVAPLFLITLCLCLLCVCACTCQCTLEEVRRSEDCLWEWTFSFHGDPRDQTQVTRLGISLPNMVLGSLVSETQREPLLSWWMLALAAGSAHAQHSHTGATATARHRNCSSSLLHPTRVLSPGHNSPEAYSVPTMSSGLVSPHSQLLVRQKGAPGQHPMTLSHPQQRGGLGCVTLAWLTSEFTQLCRSLVLRTWGEGLVVTFLAPSTPT